MSSAVSPPAADNTRLTVAAAGFTALIAVGAYISVPIGPVPIVLQNFFVLLAGIMLPGRSALAAVGVYLFLGAVGLPVFSGGTGGIGHLIGPTGGYLLSYLPAVLLISFIGDGGRRQGTDHRPPAGSRSFPLDLLALSAGALVIFAIGVPWLKLTAGMSWNTAIGTGMLPFLPGDALKVAAAAFISRAFTPRLRLLLSNER